MMVASLNLQEITMLPYGFYPHRKKDSQSVSKLNMVSILKYSRSTPMYQNLVGMKQIQ
jgi:hypothetical protein